MKVVFLSLTPCAYAHTHIYSNKLEHVYFNAIKQYKVNRASV